VFFNDHVAQIDPDAEPDPVLFRPAPFAVDHPALDLNSATHRIHYAWKFREQAVAGGLDRSASMLVDLWINQFAEVRLEAFVRPLLVSPISRE
jgi:hypothetical protein